jgi:heptosyltransferase-3
MKLKVLEKGGKKLVLAILRPLLSSPPVGPEVMLGPRPERVLVVRQDERLGNVLLITPLLEALRKILPRSHMAVLVSNRFADLLRGNPDVDQVIVFDKRQLLHNPLRFITFLRDLRRQAFELAIDSGPADGLSLNNALMTFFSGAPVRLGYLRGESHLFLNLQAPRPLKQRSEIDNHLGLLRFFFGQAPAGGVKISLTPEERQAAAQHLCSLGFREGDLIVGMHVGGRGGKAWPIDRFAHLARRLIREHHAKVILYWGPNERDVIQEFSNEPLQGLYVSPLLQIRELASQLERCTAFVSADTGPMHLALAVGTPTVTIFRVPNFERYGQQGPQNKVVYRPGGDVSVDDVLAAFVDLHSTLSEEAADR